MSEVIVRMEMPKVCITKGGYYGNCPMDRVWCVQRNAPSGTIMRDACAEMTDNIPSWCPICGVLPDEHGDLIDRDALKKQCWHDDGFDLWVSHTEIDQQPIVIAAERKDDEQIH